MVPGGNASMILNSMGKEGKQKVKDFVSSGGGYIGVCAGECYFIQYVLLFFYQINILQLTIKFLKNKLFYV
jgi:glutamine amidotransferase-like uncharacterized protein